MVLTPCLCFASFQLVCFGSRKKLILSGLQETGVASHQEDYSIHQFDWVLCFLRSMFAFIPHFVDFAHYLTLTGGTTSFKYRFYCISLLAFLCVVILLTPLCFRSWRQDLISWQNLVRCYANAIALHIAQFLCYCKKAYLCRLLDSGRQTYYWFKLTMPSLRVQPWVREKSMGSFPEQQLVIEPNPGLKVNWKINFSCTQMFFTAFVLSCWRLFRFSGGLLMRVLYVWNLEKALGLNFWWGLRS